jgi:hypothetical protein
MRTSTKPFLAAVALLSIVSILSGNRMVRALLFLLDHFAHKTLLIEVPHFNIPKVSSITTTKDGNNLASSSPSSSSSSIIDSRTSRGGDPGGKDYRSNHIDFPYHQEMRELNLTRSLRQQGKFHLKKGLVSPETFPEDLLFSVGLRHALTFRINDDFWFRHIWKNGGTTVELQTGAPQLDQRNAGNRTVVTVVRDPIDHFLAGWQECGYRNPNEMGGRSNIKTKTYDERIRTWLTTTQKRKAYHIWLGQSKNATRSTKPSCRGSCACSVHSLPQANFLITETGIIDPNIGLVGDLRELRGVLSLTRFQYNASIGNGKNSSTNSFKTRFFPRKRHLISNETMRALCAFLSLDYFVMDFEIPDACKN